MTDETKERLDAVCLELAAIKRNQRELLAATQQQERLLRDVWGTLLELTVISIDDMLDEPSTSAGSKFVS